MKRLHGLLIAVVSSFIGKAVEAAQQPGYRNAVEVRFLPGADLSPPLNAISGPLQPLIASIQKLFALSDEELYKLSSAREDLPDLRLWYVINLVAGADVEHFFYDLQLQSNVDVANFVPDVFPQPTIRRRMETTPNFEADQGYLDAAPVGINARFIWTIPGGDGNGVKVYDVERQWTQNNEDLATVANVTSLIGKNRTGYTERPEHGAAVLGALVGTGNLSGVTGISPAADVGSVELYAGDGVLVERALANAILLAVRDGSPGDVIVLEAQTDVCGLGGDNYGPVEWDQAVFDAIQTATAYHFTVVEAAGNGNVNLDQASA